MPFVPYAALSLSLTGQRRSTAAPFAGNMPTAMVTTTTCGPTASKRHCVPSPVSSADASCASPIQETDGRSFAHLIASGSTGNIQRKRNLLPYSDLFTAANAETLSKLRNQKTNEPSSAAMPVGNDGFPYTEKRKNRLVKLNIKEERGNE